MANISVKFFQLEVLDLINFFYRKQRSECQSELEGLRQQLNLVMGQRDTRVKLEMHQKELTTKKTQERRLLVLVFLRQSHFTEITSFSPYSVPS